MQLESTFSNKQRNKFYKIKCCTYGVNKIFCSIAVLESVKPGGGQDTERSRENEKKNKRRKKKMTLRSWFNTYVFQVDG